MRRLFLLLVLPILMIGGFAVSAQAQTAPCPAGSSCSAPQNFVVTFPGPTLTTSVPASVTANSGAATLTLTGTNYSASSVVELCQQTPAPACSAPTALATTFVSATSLTAVVPAPITANSGSWSVYVANPAGHAVNLQWQASPTPNVAYNAKRGAVSGGPTRSYRAGLPGRPS
jgi:hypothetical protein